MVVNSTYCHRGHGHNFRNKGLITLCRYMSQREWRSSGYHHQSSLPTLSSSGANWWKLWVKKWRLYSCGVVFRQVFKLLSIFILASWSYHIKNRIPHLWLKESTQMLKRNFPESDGIGKRGFHLLKEIGKDSMEIDQMAVKDPKTSSFLKRLVQVEWSRLHLT